MKPAAPAAVAVPIAPLVNDVRTPQYPVEAIMPPVATMPTAPLPDLFDSDGYVRDALNALFAHPQLAQWLVSEHLLARFVAFIDALPNRKVSSQLWPVKPATGSFFVQTEGDSTLIGPANSARYEAHAAALTGVDTAAAVALYVRLYPLLQQAYRELGYPQGHSSPCSIIYWLRRSRQHRSRSYVTTRETGFMPTPTLNRHPPATSC